MAFDTFLSPLRILPASLAITLATLAPAALAETPPDELRGFYARAEVSGLLERGNLHWKRNSFGACPGEGDRDIAGTGVGLRLAAGYAPTSGLGFAAEVGGSGGPLSEGGDSMTVGHAGLLVDWHPQPSSPLRLELGAGVGTASFSGPMAGCIGCCGISPVEVHGLLGPMAHIGVGYAFRAGAFELGPVLRLRGGWMYGEEASIYESARVDLYAATIGFSVTFW